MWIKYVMFAQYCCQFCCMFTDLVVKLCVLTTRKICATAFGVFCQVIVYLLLMDGISN